MDLKGRFKAIELEKEKYYLEINTKTGRYTISGVLVRIMDDCVEIKKFDTKGTTLLPFSSMTEVSMLKQTKEEIAECFEDFDPESPIELFAVGIVILACLLYLFI